MYELVYAEKYLKQLKKLPLEVQQRILKTLERIRIRPHSFIKKLVNSPHSRLRVGDYRVILNIQNGKLIILVLNVGPRKNVYKT